MKRQVFRLYSSSCFRAFPLSGLSPVHTLLAAPLLAPLTTLDGIGPATAKLITKVTGGSRIIDLLFHLPEQFIDRTYRPAITALEEGRVATLEGTITHITPPRTPRQPLRAVLTNATGHLDIVCFSPYQARKLKLHQNVAVSGMVERQGLQLSMVNPDHIVPGQQLHTIPLRDVIWPLTAGLFSSHMVKALRQAVNRLGEMPEWLPPALLGDMQWPPFTQALKLLHFPGDFPDLLQTNTYDEQAERARNRLAFDELLASQLAMGQARKQARKVTGLVMNAEGPLRTEALQKFGHPLTDAQKRVLHEIDADMASPYRMVRLLQGDVGSGKTIIALLAMLRAAQSGYQAALMAPTEILAQQHYATLSQLTSVPMAFLSASIKGAARRTILAQIAQGDLPFLIGTHALFQEEVQFHALGLSIIDEQHRFGVEQRLSLSAKGKDPDLLAMTATPIPRTLLLTQYGEMQISRIQEKPPGRIAVKTTLHALSALGGIIEGLKRAMDGGAQIFWVCPLVNESEVLDLAAAQERFTMLEQRFGAEKVGLAHGQQDTATRTAALEAFAAGKTRLLVATTVIEVGVNIPNASIMVIEHAERFGLAQLHQLRGRVGRGNQVAYCLLVHDDTLNYTAKKRLNLMRDTEDGFIIAEEDFRLRGGGDMAGLRQSGFANFRLATGPRLYHFISSARKEADHLLRIDPNLHTPQGQAALLLLKLFGKEDTLRLLASG